MSDEPSAPSTPTLDAAALANLRELDPDGRHGVLPRVLAAFQTSLARLLGQLRALDGQADVEAVAGIAHTLKSSSASVGALALAACCTEVERRLRSAGGGNGGSGGDLADDVRRMLAEGESALQAVGAELRT